ncbi:MAG: hypothetical protein ACRC75_09255 [Olsenella sp.]
MTQRRPNPHKSLEVAEILPVGTTCGVFNPHKSLELAEILPVGTTCGVLGSAGNPDKRKRKRFAVRED